MGQRRALPLAAAAAHHALRITESCVYHPRRFTAGGTVQRSMGVTSIAFAAGTFTASKPSAQFTWAVTQNTAVPAEVHASLSVVSACSQLGSSTRCKVGRAHKPGNILGGWGEARRQL